ncbi:ankyrin repeat and SOCS box protein 3 isoform X2 [Histomonas meleagridis]|uniref:ankyrin repeat and SOCS box protein 3 isoform X2 n=1 Tax=Histomonas meleagridis TaxID=135588 RepID=UPI003559E79E|nr:ankyrin repeat and SOCS box protein 3 isoform X2 [Histomonas meleagridis]KAH0798092.1 ankyrin repeat and SOCS box protein 3 isoform X2 [Histomonas meleagridis]
MSHHVQRTVSRTLQDDIIEKITNGDLEGFKALYLEQSEINRSLKPYSEIQIKTKYSKFSPPIHLHGPTPLFLAILCEQDEIVDYILKEKSPDLSHTTEGFNIIHIAALSKDYHCLRVLLKYKWVLEHINDKVELENIPTKPEFKTTALHIAVTNHNYANAFLLLRCFDFFSSSNTNSVDDSQKVYNIEIDQRSMSGSTPLYIAVYLHDIKMVKILLNAGADATIQCDRENRSPLQLSEQLLQKQIPRNPKEKPNTLQKIHEALKKFTGGEAELDLKYYILKYSPELSKEFGYDFDEEEEYDDDKMERPMEMVAGRMENLMERMIHEMSDLRKMIVGLKNRVETLESHANGEMREPLIQTIFQHPN